MYSCLMMGDNIHMVRMEYQHLYSCLGMGENIHMVRME